jgi:hypothetical protein
MAADKPFVRSRSRTILVPGAMAWGKPCQFEIRVEEDLASQTRRYRRTWLAKKAGSLAWHTGRTPAKTLLRAAVLDENRRPAWLKNAVAQAAELAKEI